MKTIIAAAILYAIAGASPASILPRQIPQLPANLNFQPGMVIPTSCFESPTLNECPAQLPSGNLLVTSFNKIINEALPDSGSEGGNGASNIFRAAFNIIPNAGLKAETTLTIFDFPTGYEKKNCSFQFVSDNGDNVPEELYSVFSLEGNGQSVTDRTTWNTKPARNEEVALFSTLSEDRVPFATEKFGKRFVAGPGYGRDQTFPCPTGGKIVWEVAQTLRRPAAGGLNVGGNGGLGIEILNAQVPWFGDRAGRIRSGAEVAP